MSAIRLPLLCAFAGGCLTNAVLFGLWRTAGAGPSSATEQHQSHNAVALVTTAAAAPSSEQSSEVVAANTTRREQMVAEPAPSQVAQDVDSAGPAPAGSAVSDVLTQLEAAYRERGSAPAPAQASATQARAVAPTESAIAAVEPARGVPSQPVAEVVPAMPTVTPTAAVVPAAVAPAAVAPAAVAAQAPVVQAFAAQDPPPPSEIHYGDVNQNTYITNVRQGDVYLIQMQQLAMLQYIQLLGASGAAAPARHVGGAGRQRGTLSSGITNPDNPWGFHFAPPNLVR